MKQYFSLPGAIIFLLMLVVTLTGCSAIGGIFKAGMWSGIIFVAIIIAIIIFIITRLGRKS